MLDVAQSYTGMIDWSDFERARTMLDETNAFAEGADASYGFLRERNHDR